MQKRLFKITYYLIQNGAATAAQLAGLCGVSVRTIYRDIDALSLAGVPVYTEKGKGGGIRILPDYILDKSLFSKEEQLQLVSHFQSLASLGAPEVDGLLNKLSAMFGKTEDWLEVDFAGWGGGQREHKLFLQIKTAILQKQVVRFAYTASYGQQTTREVEPLRIIFRGQSWYMYGFSRERQDFRYFKLTRILSLQPSGSHFTRNLPAGQRVEAPYSGETVAICLRFSSKAAFRVLDEFPQNEIEQAEDGFIVNCRMPKDDWLYSYLMSFGAEAEVLSPEEVRVELARRIQALAAIYRQVTDD